MAREEPTRAALAPVADVASHYDELDGFYRRIWGEHLHHGLWTTGRETRDEAVIALLEFVAKKSGLREGLRVCDAGCGYGATGRWLWERYRAHVTGYTVSPAQHASALQACPPGHRYVLGDWTRNEEPAASFDVVLAVESTEHMADRLEVVREAHRLLRPGGRFVIAAWLSRPNPSRWQTRFLLDPICREGMLASPLPTVDEWRDTLDEGGFTVIAGDLVGSAVRRTWRHSALGVARQLGRASGWRYLLDATKRHRRFALTVFRIWIAYGVRAMDYVVLVGRKDGQALDHRSRHRSRSMRFM